MKIVAVLFVTSTVILGLHCVELGLQEECLRHRHQPKHEDLIKDLRYGSSQRIIPGQQAFFKAICPCISDRGVLGKNGSDAQELQGEETRRFGIKQPLAQPPSPVRLNAAACYVCTDCPRVSNSTYSRYCPYTLDPTKQGKCVVYAEQYIYTKTPVYIRGCASERGSCSDIQNAHLGHSDIVKLLSCYECEGDKCNTNSASLSLIDYTMAFLAMVVSPLVAKYTLS